MNILAIISGHYGERHVANIRAYGPKTWNLTEWRAPAVLPPVIDYPEDYLPESFAPADLILSFAEHKGIAELLPDIAEMSGASAVLVAVDNENWLPRGLARQLHGWLERINVCCVTPKPLCALTTSEYGVTRRKREKYDNALIAEFAHYFGQPKLDITVDPDTRKIAAIQVQRDAVCGCARHVAKNLIGISVDEAEEKGGLLHHHYPCLASMVKLDDFNHDTLMHESGHLLRNHIGEQIKSYKKTRFLKPGIRSED